MPSSQHTKKQHKLELMSMDVLQACYSRLYSDWCCSSVRSAFTRIYMPTVGEGVVTVGDETVKLVPGNIYILPAMLEFSYSCPNYLEKLYFHISITGTDNFDLLSKIGKCMVLENCRETIAQAVKLFESESIESAVELKAMLYQTICNAISANGVKLGNFREYSKITKSALDYIARHLSASLSIEEISRELYVSRLSLQKNFRRDVDMPIGKYIDEQLLLWGERLLAENELSIREISERLGFCDQFYFSRKFTQKYLISPRRYRKMHGF